MKVDELGEISLIRHIASLLKGAVPNSSLLLGPGDDAAAWRSSYPVTIATTDALIQGVHFLPSTLSWRDLGWKALAINLSDVASMGGEPLYALVSLDLPPATEVEAVLDFYRGFLELAGKFGVSVAGGNLSQAGKVSVHVTVVGGLSSEAMLTRSGARPGDLVAVTGYLGAAAAGLRLLRAKKEGPETLLQAHRRPQPRVQEGQRLLALGLRVAMDISDGLLSDLGQMCLASGVAARVWKGRVPIHPAARLAFPRRCLAMALGGGEDYELLFAGPRERVEVAQKALDIPIAVIGQMEAGEPGRVTLVDERGRELPMPDVGWDHFGRGR